MTRRRRMTPRRRQVLEAMIDHLLANHTHATNRELGRRLGLSSTNGISEHQERLERDGFIERAAATQTERGVTWRILKTPDGEPFKLGNIG